MGEIASPSFKAHVKCLVIDTGAFIKGTKLERLASEFYTINEVFDEVRDKRSKEFLAAFPFEIKIREPSAEAYKKVVEFSRKTGDYSLLSVVDLKVLALTYMLEKEQRGGDMSHIRTEPMKMRRVEVKKQKTYSKEEEENPEDNEGTNTEVTKEEPEAELDEKKEEEESRNEEEEEGQKKAQQREEEEKNTQEEEEENEESNDEEEVGKEGEEGKGTRKLRDWGGGWIDPSNVAAVRAAGGGIEVVGEEKEELVGCVTVDYAMQRVLVQMGLAVVTVEGLRIRHLRHFVLQCFACQTITRALEKKFCPLCGNHTLVRTPVSLDSEGNVTQYHTRNRRISNRGTVYSIPLPKGGRNGNDIILTEDMWLQRTRQLHPSKKKTTNVSDPGFTFAGSLAEKQKRVQIGYGKKNPNISRPKVGKKNKNRMQQ